MSRRTSAFDVVVVGSGATGSWAAKQLTESGLTVAVVEAGPGVVRQKWRLPPRASRQPVQRTSYVCVSGGSRYFVDDVANPYSVPDDAPFRWIRGRQVGGRLHVWGRVGLRMSDREFRAADRDGVGVNWPISEDDLAPHYARVEQFMGIDPGGALAGLGYGERILKTTVESRWPDRLIVGRPLARDEPGAVLDAASRSGRLTVFADHVVSHVLVAKDGRTAEGVAFIRRFSGRAGEIRAGAVFLCASTIETTRILLNSGTERHPGGLGNSSGLLGRFLTDHSCGVEFRGIAPSTGGPEQDATGDGAYVPSFRNRDVQEAGFKRGYGMEVQVLPAQATHGSRNTPRPQPRFWAAFFGEVLPNADNRVSLDPTLRDAYGLPAASIACRYGDNERRMAKDAHESLGEMLATSGFEADFSSAELSPPGFSSHELGSARMGSSPESSVLDPTNRCWDCPNLYVTDGSAFPSAGYQNPTLTMMALTVRAAEDAVGRFQAGELVGLGT